MNIQIIPISEIKLNEENPRYITDDKFKQLVKSIKDFPEMLKIRPVVIDENNIALGGNMRLRASLEAGITEIPVIKAVDLTEKQKQEFIIKDNVGFGSWDWDLINNNWDVEELKDWGLEVWDGVGLDYDLLEDESLDDEMDKMTEGVKKAILIEFESDNYEEAAELVKFFRERGAYIGGMVLEHFKAEKEKL